MADLTVKRGDLLPAVAASLRDNNQAVNLAGATVKFLMKLPGAGSPKVTAAATVTNAAQGDVQYSWVGTDTDTVGLYNAEFEVTFSGGAKATFPNKIPEGHSTPYYLIEITEDLG